VSAQLSTTELAEAMRAQRLVPVIRAADADTALERARRSAAAGLRVLELTTTIPDWLTVVEAVRSETGILLGIGTVTTAEQATTAIDAGAGFLVTPRLSPPVRDTGRDRVVPVIEAGFTPTELAEAGTGGIAKLFPAHVGGVAYLRSLRPIMPDLRVIPTGGIAIGEVPDWIEAGALAVGVGSDLTATNDLEGRLHSLRDTLRQRDV
jgi:2-dehydro-3-deoxyphosphogluconate aldolase / (4S)-4-hydroxy-2-oxoglutarate aldolase